MRDYTKKPLEQVDTADLIQELKSREGVESGSVGVFGEFKLVARYTRNPHRQVDADEILIIGRKYG